MQNLRKVAQNEWPARQYDPQRIEVWASSQFLVQVFTEHSGIIRLTVNRVGIIRGSRWKAGVTWDELQEIKDALGYADQDAVEIYPRQRDIVNVANMRHLWVLPEPLAFGWRK